MKLTNTEININLIVVHPCVQLYLTPQPPIHHSPMRVIWYGSLQLPIHDEGVGLGLHALVLKIRYQNSTSHQWKSNGKSVKQLNRSWALARGHIEVPAGLRSPCWLLRQQSKRITTDRIHIKSRITNFFNFKMEIYSVYECL